MVPKLLTDARETSYCIRSPLLTAECSTVELPGNCVGLSHSSTATPGSQLGHLEQDLLERTAYVRHLPQRLVGCGRWSRFFVADDIALRREAGTTLKAVNYRSHGLEIVLSRRI